MLLFQLNVKHLVLDNCTGLRTLDGAPKVIGGSSYDEGDLSINNCTNLRDFGNTLQSVDRDLYCKNCPKLNLGKNS